MKFVAIALFILLSFSLKEEAGNFNPVSEENFTPEQFKLLVQGILEGIKLDKFIDDIMSCIGYDAPEIYQLLKEAVDDLKEIDWQHVKLIEDALLKVAEAFTIIFKDLIPCSKFIPEITKIILKLSKENFFSIAWRIIKGGGKMYQDLKDLPTFWKAEDYLSFGNSMGDLLYLIFLS